MFFTKNKKFTTVVKDWLLYKRLSLKKSTFCSYKYIINKYVLSYFENKRIYFFINYDFNLYVKELSETLSTASVKMVLTIFKSLMKYIERLLDVDFKLDLLGTPKKTKNKIEILNSKDINTIENYCMTCKAKDYRNIGIELSLLTGMRLGEICALKWKNIDLKNGFIKVRETMQRVYLGKDKTEISIDNPKTLSSVRDIPISNKLLPKLNEIYNNNNFTGEEFFLTGKTCKFLEPRTLERTFDKCLLICEVKHFKFHTLRHTFATNCIRKGMDVKSLSMILGHSNVQITLNKYVHPSFDDQVRFVNML